MLGLVEENYASDVDSDKAVYGAIDGMLRTLDPHSKFFDPKAFSSLREDQRGKYYGLGITVTTRFGKVTVVSPPFLGSPAEKVGLRVGDVISHVNGEPTQGMDLNEVVSKLKGPRGTSVKIRVVRPGTEEPIEMAVIRDEIAKFTISNAFILRPRIGYIKLDSFAETTGQELRDALKKLRDDLQAHLEQMMLRLEHISANETVAFAGLCAELEHYLADLSAHGQKELELLQKSFAQEDGGSG